MPLVVIPVVGRTHSSAVADDGHLPATGTLAGKPLAVLGTGVAFSPATWDKYDHTRHEGTSWSLTGQGTLLHGVAFAPMYQIPN